MASGSWQLRNPGYSYIALAISVAALLFTLMLVL
jgi:hypothetical protein